MKLRFVPHKMAFYCSFLLHIYICDHWKLLLTLDKHTWIISMHCIRHSKHLWSVLRCLDCVTNGSKNYPVYWTLIVTTKQKRCIVELFDEQSMDAKFKRSTHKNSPAKKFVQFSLLNCTYLTATFHCDFPFASVEFGRFFSTFTVPKTFKRSGCCFGCKYSQHNYHFLALILSQSVTLVYILPFTVATENSPELYSVRSGIST